VRSFRSHDSPGGTCERASRQREIVDRVAKEVMAETGVKVKYLAGTMIELPRAAITADQIAQAADFFSYGTNDLTRPSSASPGMMPESSSPSTGKKASWIRPLRLHRPSGVGKSSGSAWKKAARPIPAGSRHLRRTRGRPELGGVLPPDRAGLRLLLALSGPHRPSGRGPGGHRVSTKEITKRLTAENAEGAEITKIFKIFPGTMFF